jgi:hypothetical protein
MHLRTVMTASRLAWIRKYWPITMTAAYLVCHALIYVVGSLCHLPPERLRTVDNGSDLGLLWHLPPENSRIFRNGPDVLGGVLFGASFFGMRWFQLGRRRLVGGVIVLLSLIGQGWFIYIDFYTAQSAAFLAEFRLHSDNRISRLPEAAMRSNRGHPGHSGRVAAQFYFRETGVAIPYRDESDQVRMFVPNDKATASREGEREGRELLEKSRPMFRAHALTFRWFGISNLFVAAAAVLVAMGLFWRRKLRGAVDAVELPIAGQ